MTCYFPLPAVYTGKFTKNGKQDILVLPRTEVNLFRHSMRLPCGNCVGCRLKRSSHWAARCLHEASLYGNGRHNCFITLTYSDEFLPKVPGTDVPTLVKRDFQLFMKRLRKMYGEGIRFFHCGEYGERFGRPHFHALIFNFDFSDKYLFKTSNGLPLYRSVSLEKLWPYGHSSVGDVTFESAAYVARYVLKKVNGENSFLHYSVIDSDSGEYFGKRQPEYITMSRRPGIASDWYDRFGKHCVENQRVVIGNRPMSVPKFYESRYELMYPAEMDAIREERKRVACLPENKANSTSDRLNVRFKVKSSQVKLLIRPLDSGLV